MKSFQLFRITSTNSWSPSSNLLLRTITQPRFLSFSNASHPICSNPCNVVKQSKRALPCLHYFNNAFLNYYSTLSNSNETCLLHPTLNHSTNYAHTKNRLCKTCSSLYRFNLIHPVFISTRSLSTMTVSDIINESMDTFSNLNEKKIQNTHHFNNPSSSGASPDSADLTKQIENLIKFNGPISVAQYMRLALTHPKHGYYIQNPVFGKKGDYVTSPEISQLFGEMIGIWWVYLWQNSVLKKQVSTDFQLIELGPGRGTLLADIWRTFSNFKDVASQCQSIVMVEASFSLREVQLQNMCPDAIDIQRSSSGHLLSAKMKNSGTSLLWLEHISELDPSTFSFIIVHEFFDALPIFKFKYTEHGWREIMIDMDTSPNAKYPFRYVLSPRANQASQSLPSFFPTLNSSKIDETIEVSPESHYYANKIGKLLNQVGGVALVMDYGEVGSSNASLRAIRNHQFVNLFESPGMCDLSANVDFQFLNSAFYSVGLQTYPILTQQAFLMACGIQYRLKALIEQHPSLEKVLRQDYQRLIGPMGQIYKCCVATSKLKDVPLGFDSEKAESST